MYHGRKWETMNRRSREPQAYGGPEKSNVRPYLRDSIGKLIGNFSKPPVSKKESEHPAIHPERVAA